MESTNELPDFITNLFKNAWDARSSEANSFPVFKLTYENKSQVDWGPFGKKEIKKYPNSISLTESSYGSNYDESTFEKNDEENKSNVSASMHSEYSGTIYSGSADSSINLDEERYSSKENFYLRNYKYMNILEFERIGNELHPDFIKRIKSLPKDISSKTNKKAYTDFINDYGTHVVSKGSIGGILIMETTIRKSLITSSEKMDVKAQVSGSFDTVVTSGSMDISTAVKSSNFLSKNKESTLVSMKNKGGVYNSKEGINGWQNSLYSQGILLMDRPNCKEKDRKTKFNPISELVSIAGGHSKVKQHMEFMIEEYIYGEADVSPILRYSNKKLNFDQVYDVDLKAGFVIGTNGNENDGHLGSIQIYNPINTLRMSASMHQWTPADILVPCSSFTMPKSAGTSIVNRKEKSIYTSEKNITFVSFNGLKREALGDWKSVDLNTIIIAEEDGFLVANVDVVENKKNGTASEIIGYIYNHFHKNESTGNDGWDEVAGASQQYVEGGEAKFIPRNSFCMPVKKGRQYFIRHNKWAGEPTSQAFFIPLSKNILKFGEFKESLADTVQTTKEDGFLIAFLDGSKGRGIVDLYCSKDKFTLKNLNKEDIKASTSVHYYPEINLLIRYNSVMIPVPKGYTYLANLKMNSDNFGFLPDIKVYWMPLKRVR